MSDNYSIADASLQHLSGLSRLHSLGLWIYRELSEEPVANSFTDVGTISPTDLNGLRHQVASKPLQLSS